MRPYSIPDDKNDSSEFGQAVGALARFSHHEPVLYKEGLRRIGPDTMAELERCATLFHLDRLWSNHLAWIQDTRDSIHLVNLGGREPIEEFRKWATDEFLKMQDGIEEAVISEMTAFVRKDGPVDLELERLKGPSSTWTYLVNETQFGWGIELTKAKNIGFVRMAFLGPGAAFFAVPMFLLTLLLARRSRRKRKSR
jgi:preprotein translocase subunit SecA